MAGCFRCIVTISAQSPHDPVGSCLNCGALACRHCGDRDAAAMDFHCGLCVPSRLSVSAGLPPPPPPSGPPGGPPGPRAPAPPPDSGFSGAIAAPAFAGSEDFVRRLPAIAGQSAEHRAVWRERIDERILHLEAQRDDPTARELSHGGDDFDERQLRALAIVVAYQLHEARRAGTLDRMLLADALGVAAWAIGAEPGRAPEVQRLRHLSDPRLQLVVGRFTPEDA